MLTVQVPTRNAVIWKVLMDIGIPGTPDIVTGTGGILTRIREIQVVAHKMFQAGADFYEEREGQAARVQLQMVGHLRVRGFKSFKSFKSFKLGSPMVLDVDEVCNYDAG